MWSRALYSDALFLLFGFFEAFPRYLTDQCESVLPRVYLQYGFTAVIQMQLLSNLIPK